MMQKARDVLSKKRDDSVLKPDKKTDSERLNFSKRFILRMIGVVFVCVGISDGFALHLAL